MSQHSRALVQALIVIVIWSASWVLIKIGLEDVRPLTFAGLRYIVASAILCVIAARSAHTRAAIRAFSLRDWAFLIVFGVIWYAVTQGAQFAALEKLPSVTLSLIITFTPVVVLLIAAFTLGERPSWLQGVGVMIFLGGVILYFGLELPAAQFDGLLIGLLCMVSNAVSGVMGRYANKDDRFPVLALTTVSMTIGSIVLLIVALIEEAAAVSAPADLAMMGEVLPRVASEFSLRAVVIIVWLGSVHTALTYILWNLSLQHLTALESSVINNLMLAFIAALAWVFLGETLDEQQVLGLVVATIGIMAVQIRWKRV
jgi:drug/metabolite transporter (DMT)-like permease